MRKTQYQLWRLAIELDDKSHLLPKSISRDSFVESACKSAALPLIRFDVKAIYQIQSVRDKIIDALNSHARSSFNRSSTIHFKSNKQPLS